MTSRLRLHIARALMLVLVAQAPLAAFAANCVSHSAPAGTDAMASLPSAFPDVMNDVMPDSMSGAAPETMSRALSKPAINPTAETISETNAETMAMSSDTEDCHDMMVSAAKSEPAASGDCCDGVCDCVAQSSVLVNQSLLSNDGLRSGALLLAGTFYRSTHPELTTPPPIR